MINMAFLFLRTLLIPLIFLGVAGVFYFLLVVFIDAKGDKGKFFKTLALSKEEKQVYVKEKPIEKSLEKPLLQEEQKLKETYRVVADIINIRAEPSVRAKISGRAYKNELLEVEYEQNSWGKTQKGYVFLDPKNIAKQQKKILEEYRIQADIVNIRLLPTSKSRLIKRAYKNEVVVVETIEEGWAKLEQGGYISLEFLKKIHE